MAADEPPYLTIGTDVSAKYKGAFCEAKIKKVMRVVKCKVNFKNNLGTFMITDDQIKGPLRIGAEVDAKHPEKNQFLDAVINKLQDYSQYTVVFDDGDETTLRRTSLCLKSGRHFAESPTLDQFPLTNPEHFGTPVIGSSKFKRKRRSTMNSSLDYDSSDDESLPKKVKAIRDKEQNPDLGKVVCVDFGDRRKKENWYPGLIVPHPAQSTIKISKEEHLIRSFKDGKYYQVPKRDIRDFFKDYLPKIENNALRLGVEKAINYLEKDELPPHWEKVLFAGLDTQSAEEDSNDSDSDSSDDEPSEEKDRFVAQLYKFMDERGTPINKAPSVCNRDLNLYKLFKIMHKLGGYNKVTNKNKWRIVYSKMGLPPSNMNGPNQIKVAYKRFLQSFEDFYRKLGCTMVSNSRSTRGRHRSDRNIIITRTREKETSSPKSKNGRESLNKAPSDKKAEEKPKVVEEKKVKAEETPKTEEKSKSPDKKKIEKTRAEPKKEDEKTKKDEKPRHPRSQSLNKEKKDIKPEKARTREDARKEKNESPEKKGTRSSLKMEPVKKEESPKEKKEVKSPKEKEKKDEKPAKDPPKEEKPKIVKKEEKIIRERKITREKKVEEKIAKEKRESLPREKQNEKPAREKRDSSKECKDEKPPVKIKKEPPKEETPAKKKVERPSREKTEDNNNKTPRSKVEEKEVSKKPEEVEPKPPKEVVKIEVEVKKEEPIAKEKLRPKLRERKEGTPVPGDETNLSGSGDAEELEEGPPEMPGFKDDMEDSANKNKKKSLRAEDKDDKDSIIGLSDSDESGTNDSDKNYGTVKHNEIEVNDRVKVKYGRGRLQKVYEAKVLKIDMEGGERRFYVHYAGWNTRYDEWVRKNYIVACISGSKVPKSEGMGKNFSPVEKLKKVDRGRPPGLLANTKLDRKNSTSSTNSRAMRSEKKGSLPLSGGLEPKKRTRRKSGTLYSNTDASQESDGEGPDVVDLEEDDDDDGENLDSSLKDESFKEELFSDDDEKEKMEDVKRDDIIELEKAITVEEGGDETKSLPFDACVDESRSNDEKNDQVKLEKEAESVKNDQESNLKGKDTSLPSNSNESSNNLSSVPLKDEKRQVIEAPKIVLKDSPLSSSPALPSGNEKVVSEKVPDVLPTSVAPSVTSIPAKTVSKISSPLPAKPPESKTALSFAGLIKKSSFELVSSPQKSIASGVPSHPPSLMGLSSVPTLPSKPIAENPFRALSVFGSTLQFPQKPESGKKIEEKKASALSLKPESESAKVKPAAAVESKDKTMSPEASSDSKLSIKSFTSTSSPSETKSPEKKSILSSPKLSILDIGNSKEPVSKPKDKFDMLLESTNDLKVEAPKLPEIKDNIFSFSFGSSSVIKDSSSVDPLGAKSSAESTSRVKPKPIETMDVSKMIPGILERLKKDVVADLKVSDSPPPPKEELSFDFLRGSQSATKSLSRSESSNSLRICESDTNDSNAESKDFAVAEKLDVPVVVPNLGVKPAEDKAVCIEAAKPLSEDTPLKSIDTSSINTKDELVSTLLPEQRSDSLISTTLSPREEILPAKEALKDDLEKPVLPQLDVTSEDKKKLETEDTPKSISSENANVKVALVHHSSPVESPGPKQESSGTEKSEVPQQNTMNKSDKDALFEEIRTISTYGQSSVIKSTVSSMDSSTSENKQLPDKDSNLPVKQTELEEPMQIDDPKLPDETDLAGAPMKESTSNSVTPPESEYNADNQESKDDNLASQTSKKDMRKKKFGKKLGKKMGSTENSEKEDKDAKVKEGKIKSKKRLRMEGEGKGLDTKVRSKKMKKNKNKKRFSRHEDDMSEHLRKFDFRDDEHRDSVTDKFRRKDKRKNERKFLKSGLKHDELSDSKNELPKKKKSKKNRDKLMSDKKEFFEKKTKKKRKIMHAEENQDTDSEKEVPKLPDKKRKKERKKFKVSRECSSSDEGTSSKYFKEKKSFGSASLLRQDSSKSDDQDMSFLLCEEKVPASPGEDTSGSSNLEDNGRLNSGLDLLPSVYPCCSNSDEPSVHKHNIDNVLDNTPPTTPSSTESLLSSSPSHERDSFSVNYPESTQSGENDSDLFHINTNRSVARGSEEYSAATTLAFAVCKSSVSGEKSKEDASSSGFGKRLKPQLSPPKRKKKRVQRYSEAAKSPKHKSSFTRVSKVENYCEDSSGTSPATSNSPPYANISALSFNRSLPHRLSGISETSTSRTNYLQLNEKDPEKRIAVLQDKMTQLRKRYMALRAEVIAIDHKRRRARKKVREAAGNVTSLSVQSEDAHSCS